MSSSVLITSTRLEVHGYIEYPHIFVEDDEKGLLAMVTLAGKEVKRYLPPFFSRKDSCHLSGWRLPSTGEGECVVQLRGKSNRTVKVRFKDGDIEKVVS